MRNHNADSRCQSLYFQASILNLRQHFLNSSNFVNNIKMISVIKFLMKRTCVLLTWVYKGLYFYVCHFESLSKGLRFSFEHRARHFNHILLQLILNHFNLTWSLIKHFQNCRILVLCHNTLYSSSHVLSFHTRNISFCSLSSIFLDSVHMTINFPEHIIIIHAIQTIIFLNVKWNSFLALDYHEDSFWLTCFYLYF